MTTGRSTAPPARRPLATATGNRASRLYLLVVLTLLIWAAVDASLVHQQDASFAAIFPVLATAPLGFAVALLPDSSPLGSCMVVACAALVNAWLIGLVAQRRR
ncbi:SCO4225 family membrane protein [Streptomyces sp. TR06-5]|uniref:SCO4225 family membrane protein n=1 Tax=unclassified Streptomyces TaxID=2593676 RepID=UPI0039A2D53F